LKIKNMRTMDFLNVLEGQKMEDFSGPQVCNEEKHIQKFTLKHVGIKYQKSLIVEPRK
jgi:hypothetical protein